MRLSGRKPSVTIAMTPPRTSSDSLRIAPPPPLAVTAAAAPDSAAETEVMLSPSGFTTVHTNEINGRAERHRHLAIAIRQRIESRLAGRVHDLAIRVRDNTVVLEGRCATFYTKQLAQHAALGVLEDERLENDIVVMM